MAIQSLSSWERGLKCIAVLVLYRNPPVALFMGAWIEISVAFASSLLMVRRSLHGSVD